MGSGVGSVSYTLPGELLSPTDSALGLLYHAFLFIILQENYT